MSNLPYHHNRFPAKTYPEESKEVEPDHSPVFHVGVHTILICQQENAVYPPVSAQGTKNKTIHGIAALA